MHILKSKIVLGTAQFGLSYGVSNQLGKTTESDVVDILNYAHNNGINYLDTASLYGDSESVIGRFANKDHWKIITKTPIISDKVYAHKSLIKSTVKKSFNNSLVRLRRDSVASLLVHLCDDLFTEHGRVFFETISEFKSNGYIDKIGVSVYNKDQIERLLEEYDVDIVQLPINILDQRLMENDYLSYIKSHGVEIHARSIFLQGLLLMDLKDIPLYFKPIFGQLKLFKNKAKELSISPLSLALSYVNSIKELDYFLVGINNVKQLQEIVEAPIIEAPSEDFRDLFVNDGNFIDPSKWNI
jgi:aryl-alcohol dehydrogenase-like predicted oxidoreductase